MQYSFSIGQIEQRAQAVNVCLKTLAQSAGLHPSTAYRGAKAGADVKISTASRLGDALVAEELRLLRHLALLHPQEAIAACCPEKRSAA